VGVGLIEGIVWYTLKYDRTLMLPFANDDDVVNLLRGNDDHAYMYIVRTEGRRAHHAFISDQQPRGDCDAGVRAGVPMGRAASVRKELTRNGEGEVCSLKMLR